MESILKASYGDKEQRSANHRNVNNNAAAQVMQPFKERRAAHPRPEVSGPPEPRSYQPPFWDPKLHGEAFGDFNKKPVRTAAHQLVEIRPGILHAVHQNPLGRPASGRLAAAPPGGGGGQRPGSAPAARGRSSPSRSPPQHPAAGAGGARQPVVHMAAPRAYQKDTKDVAPEVAALEEVMREQLRRRSAMHLKEKVVLLRAFAKAIGKRSDVDIGAPDRVGLVQFMATWKLLGMDVKLQHAEALFNKYGQDARGELPIMVFTEALLMGAPRLVMAANDIQKGAFTPGRPATHMGKILYPECKKGVFPPSDWEPWLAERSAQLPDVRLQLEFVYGYDGQRATSPNMFYTASGEVAYHTAAVGIVFDKARHTQRFFLGHDDDICCLAMHPGRTLVATGQLGKDPCAIVWDSSSTAQLQKLHHGYGYRGIQACAFSPDGELLATVATDNSHSLFVWHWRTKRKILERKSQPGAPPAVYGVVWSPFEADRLVTYGQNHIRFWRLSMNQVGADGSIGVKSDAGTFANIKTHSVMGAAFLPSGILLSGSPDGSIFVWSPSGKCQREVKAHAPGAVTSRPDGTRAYGGVRCLVLQDDRRTLLTGGSDGYVIKWDVSSGDLGAQLSRMPLLSPEAAATGSPPPMLRALDALPGSEVFVAGDSSCDVWEVDGDPEVLIPGHEGDLYALAMNPAYPHIFATISNSDCVTLWSAVTRKALRIVSMGKLKARSGAFSPDGKQLAVGMTNGGIKVLEFYPETIQIWWGKTFSSSVDVLQYSPDGRYLAAGSHDQFIDVFDVSCGYRRLSRLAGHSSTVTHLDWSQDSTTIQSTDQAYEILYFDARSGRQVKENQRDTVWASWTCILGFPVMGIWPPDSDGTDINSCHRSPSGRYLLTADDLGKVKLFNSPCVVRQAPSHVYCGHSSHVMNVRWASDEAFAVSVGGKDRSVLLWRLVPAEKPKDPHVIVTPWAPMDEKGLVWAPRAEGGGGQGAPQGMAREAWGQQQQQQGARNQDVRRQPAPAARGRESPHRQQEGGRQDGAKRRPPSEPKRR